MNPLVCSKCWSSPCTCGYKYQHLTNDHLLILIHNLTQIVKARELDLQVTIDDQNLADYLENQATTKTYNSSSSLLSLLTEQQFELAEPYRNYLLEKETANAVYHDLRWTKAVPFRCAFAFILYQNNLGFTDSFLHKFTFTLLNRFTCLFDNPSLKELLDPNLEHELYLNRLYTATSQCQVILSEQLAKVDPEWLSAWAILIRIEQLFLGDLNTKFKALKQITELIAGVIPVTPDIVRFVPTEVVSEINQMKYYDICDLEDEELLDLFYDPAIVNAPHFGSLKAH